MCIYDCALQIYLTDLFLHYSKGTSVTGGDWAFKCFYFRVKCDTSHFLTHIDMFAVFCPVGGTDPKLLMDYITSIQNDKALPRRCLKSDRYEDALGAQNTFITPNQSPDPNLVETQWKLHEEFEMCFWQKSKC